MKFLAKAFAVLLILIASYAFFLYKDIQKVNNFCDEMVTGLDINQIYGIAEKYNVGLKIDVRDPNAVKNKTLGSKDENKENTWFFVVASPMTMGDYGCIVYHDYHTVLTAIKTTPEDN